MKLLEINNLTTEFTTPQGQVQAVRDVSYSWTGGKYLESSGSRVPGKASGCFL